MWSHSSLFLCPTVRVPLWASLLHFGTDCTESTTPNNVPTAVATVASQLAGHCSVFTQPLRRNGQWVGSYVTVCWETCYPRKAYMMFKHQKKSWHHWDFFHEYAIMNRVCVNVIITNNRMLRLTCSFPFSSNHSSFLISFSFLYLLSSLLTCITRSSSCCFVVKNNNLFLGSSSHFHSITSRITSRPSAWSWVWNSTFFTVTDWKLN